MIPHDRIRMVAKGVKADTVMHLGPCRCWVVLLCRLIWCLPSREYLVPGGAVQMDPAKGTIQSLMEQFVLAALPSATSSLVCQVCLEQEANFSWKHMESYSFAFQSACELRLIQEISQSGTDVSNFTLSIMVKTLGASWRFMEIQEATNCSKAASVR